MPTKDYYQILEVPSTADAAAIKAAFRRLAHRFHPDKNQGAPYAAARFQEIHEAYSVLNNPQSRSLYDRARYGNSRAQTQRETVLVTGDWLLTRSESLLTHVREVDSARMDQEAVRIYCLRLLTDAHLAVLHQEPNVTKKIAQQLLEVLGKVDFPHAIPVIERLRLAVVSDEDLLRAINNFSEKRRFAYRWERAAPFFVACLAMVACLLIMLFARI